MLTVWTVCNGDKYTDDDVLAVRFMVARHLDQPYRFRCLADREITGIDTFVPDEQWPGWWAKTLLFRYSTGLNLYLDLDVVVVGPLDDLVSEQLSLPANWAQSGHGGCQSSVMSWGLDYSYLPDLFRVEDLDPPTPLDCGRYHGLHGDQDYITLHMGSPGDGSVAPMRGVYSYKYHCQNGPPADARVVAFHGTPKPAEVNAEWVKQARLSTVTEV